MLHRPMKKELGIIRDNAKTCGLVGLALGSFSLALALYSQSEWGFTHRRQLSEYYRPGQLYTPPGNSNTGPDNTVVYFNDFALLRPYNDIPSWSGIGPGTWAGRNGITGREFWGDFPDILPMFDEDLNGSVNYNELFLTRLKWTGDEEHIKINSQLNEEQIKSLNAKEGLIYHSETSTITGNVDEAETVLEANQFSDFTIEQTPGYNTFLNVVKNNLLSDFSDFIPEHQAKIEDRIGWDKGAWLAPSKARAAEALLKDYEGSYTSENKALMSPELFDNLDVSNDGGLSLDDGGLSLDDMNGHYWEAFNEAREIFNEATEETCCCCP